ncbi:MAG: hypothetical protein EOP45_03885 [Sphingobacteriaceae bacterium]|nr:MAG: hypothetical protein EOP45_03885 [Sphingobacteriaceae bacterium]
MKCSQIIKQAPERTINTLNGTQSDSLFSDRYTLFSSLLGEPLSKLRMPLTSGYSLHLEYPHANLIAKRIEVVKQMGTVANLFESESAIFGTIWGQTLAGIRKQYPDATNPHQNKQWGGRVFPYMYKFNENEFPRLSSHPSHIVRDAYKPWRKPMILKMTEGYQSKALDRKTLFCKKR